MSERKLFVSPVFMPTRAEIIEDSCNSVDVKEGDCQEITGLCYCENDLCRKMWPVSCGVDGPKDTDGRTILPCGHRLERLVASAECFRSDNRDAEDFRWLRDHFHIDDDAMDALEEYKTDKGI